MAATALSVAIGILLQGAAPDPHVRAPDQLVGTFTTISIEVEFLGDCLDQGDGDRTDIRYERLERRYWDTRRRVQAIWGSAENPAAISEHFFTEAFFPEKRRRCRKAQVQTALDNVNAKLAEIEQSLSSADTQQRTGAWVGAFRLCKDTVSQTEIITSDWNGEPALRVTLTATGRDAFAILTERASGESLAARVDDQVVSEPSFNETLQGDSFHIQTRDPQALDRIRTLAMSDC